MGRQDRRLPPLLCDRAGLHCYWEALRVDFSVAGLLAGVFGTRAWMAEVGRRGGRATTEAKAAAARANGAKGGRPKKSAPAVTASHLQP